MKSENEEERRGGGSFSFSFSLSLSLSPSLLNALTDPTHVTMMHTQTPSEATEQRCHVRPAATPVLCATEQWWIQADRQSQIQITNSMSNKHSSGKQNPY